MTRASAGAGNSRGDVGSSVTTVPGAVVPATTARPEAPAGGAAAGGAEGGVAGVGSPEHPAAANPASRQGRTIPIRVSPTVFMATNIMTEGRAGAKPINTPGQVLFASLVGTAIEFFDFYIYATAAVLVFPRLFFPASDPASATLASLAAFGIAFLARPIGSAVFGHFGDRVGRKTTLVAALLTMGVSTVTIGALPTYASIGIAAPLLLALCRFGQGLGLGGEWGGAVLLATENAPPGKRAWYGMFPQLGAPIGFLFSGSTFLLLSRFL